MNGSAQIIRADARALPLAEDTVDLVVTSPPYFALRSYTDGGEHYAGQIGSEATPAEFLDALLDVTRECVRVLKPSGSLWVNLGDKYVSSGGHTDNGASTRLQGRPNIRKQGRPDRSTCGNGIATKSLMGLPWRYAIRCIDELGLILRAEVVWSKPNGLPESVTDRVRRSHEQWFHFTLQPRYFAAVDEIREPHVRSREGGRNGGHSHASAVAHIPGTPANLALAEPNPLGKLPGSVWTVPSEPLTLPAELGVDHFAAFPMEWPRRIIQGWCPREVCPDCGEGRRPVTTSSLAYTQHTYTGSRTANGTGNVTNPGGKDWIPGRSSTAITGYICACPDTTAPATPGVCLDPFGGTGTVALVAKALGRTGIHVDMSADYNRIAQWRTTDRDQLAKAMQVQRSDAARAVDAFDIEPLFGEAS